MRTNTHGNRERITRHVRNGQPDIVILQRPAGIALVELTIAKYRSHRKRALGPIRHFEFVFDNVRGPRRDGVFVAVTDHIEQVMALHVLTLAVDGDRVVEIGVAIHIAVILQGTAFVYQAISGIDNAHVDPDLIDVCRATWKIVPYLMIAGRNLELRRFPKIQKIGRFTPCTNTFIDELRAAGGIRPPGLLDA